jgi:seryl-tRNA synthetase
MLNLKQIRENADAVRRAITDKHVALNLDELLAVADRVVELTQAQQSLQATRNRNAKLIPGAAAEARPGLIAEGRKIGEELASLKPAIDAAEAELRDWMLKVPNIPAENAPRGASEADNVVVRIVGEPTRFGFTPLDHIELLERHGWSDMLRIARIAGSRSYVLKGLAVLLEQSLLRFALDRLAERGFTPVSVPSFASEEAFIGTGHFPAGRDQVYHIELDDKYLAGTSEVTLNSLHSGEILSETALPIRYAGISTCFRREAGSAGKDVRGLIRVHQFNKVEQYVMCKNDPAESDRWHMTLLEISESILADLEIPYRVVECCTGDMGLGKYRMFDIESWVPSEQLYRETHSCSNLHEWQARRANLRYRDSQGKVQFCHTLNNTAIATPRFLVPLLENHQQADGSIHVPEKLRPYLGNRAVLGDRPALPPAPT